MVGSGRSLLWFVFVLVYGERAEESSGRWRRCSHPADRGWCEAFSTGEKFTSAERFRAEQNLILSAPLDAPKLFDSHTDNSTSLKADGEEVRNFRLWAMELHSVAVIIFREGYSNFLDRAAGVYCNRKSTTVHVGLAYLPINQQLIEKVEANPQNDFNHAVWKEKRDQKEVIDVFYFCCASDSYCGDFIRAGDDSSEITFLLLNAYFAPPPSLSWSKGKRFCYKSDLGVQFGFDSPCIFLLSTQSRRKAYAGYLVYDNLELSRGEEVEKTSLLNSLVSENFWNMTLGRSDDESGNCWEYLSSEEYYAYCICFWQDYARFCEFAFEPPNDRKRMNEKLWRTHSILQNSYPSAFIQEPVTAVSMRGFLLSESRGMGTGELQDYSTMAQWYCARGSLAITFDDDGKPIEDKEEIKLREISRADRKMSSVCIAAFTFVFSKEKGGVQRVIIGYNSKTQDGCDHRRRCILKQPKCPNEQLSEFWDQNKPNFVAYECCCANGHLCNYLGTATFYESIKYRNRCTVVSTFLYDSMMCTHNTRCMRYFDFTDGKEVLIAFEGVSVDSSDRVVSETRPCFTLEVRYDRTLFCDAAASKNSPKFKEEDKDKVYQQLPQQLLACQCNFSTHSSSGKCDEKFDSKFVAKQLKVISGRNHSAEDAPWVRPSCEEFDSHSADRRGPSMASNKGNASDSNDDRVVRLRIQKHGQRQGVVAVDTLRVPLCSVTITVNTSSSQVTFKVGRVENEQLESFFSNGISRTEFSNDLVSSTMNFLCRSNKTDLCNSLENVRKHYLPHFIINFLKTFPTTDVKRAFHQLEFMSQTEGNDTIIGGTTSTVVRSNGFANFGARTCMDMERQGTNMDEALCFLINTGDEPTKVLCCQTGTKASFEEINLKERPFHLFFK